MITYKEFVEELSPFIEEAEGLKRADRRDKDPNFRRWRHRVTELIIQIKEQGYSVSCPIYNRQFRGFGDTLSKIEGYVRDLNDTIIELETIVDHYDKYGVPKKAERTNEANSIKSGLIPTIRELLLSLPFDQVWKMLAAIITILGIIFYAGFYAGTFYEKHFFVESEAVIKDESAK